MHFSSRSAARALSALALFILLALPLSAGAAVIRTETLAVLPNAKDPAAPLPLDDKTPQPLLEIWFGRVSACDAIVVRCQGETMMIDGGDRPHVRLTNDFIDSLGLTKVDYLFNTHHHDDHIDAQESLVRRGLLSAKVFLSPYPRGYNVETQRRMEATVDKAGIEYRTLQDGDTMTLGGENGALIEFFRWSGSTDANYASMFCRITYGGRSVLLMADVIGLAQQQLAIERPDLPWKADVLKAGHHGYTRQDPALLAMIAPELCVVTNSRIGGDPTVQQMIKLEIPWLVTNGGTIYLRTDGGEDWLFNVKRHVY